MEIGGNFLNPVRMLTYRIFAMNLENYFYLPNMEGMAEQILTFHVGTIDIGW